MESSSYSELKQFFVDKRRDFKENPESAADLDAYARCDNTHNYTALRGLIPPTLVGKKNPGGQEYRKSDTFFSDFLMNHPDRVLSESDESLVIGNVASHDTRQYLKEWDPEGKDKTAAAGMSYMHVLVIPKKRVYNAVALDNTAIINEMLEHFRSFWSSDPIDKITRWLNTAVEQRATAVRASLKSHAPDKIVEFDAVMKKVLASSEKFASELSLHHKSKDDKLFFFGFHPAPHASIGHLHMHVILMPAEFREFSAKVHDWKTVPAQAVIDVIDEETRRCDTHSTKPWWWRMLMSWVGA